MTHYPKIDRSNLIPEKHRDVGYGEGTLKDKEVLLSMTTK